MQEVLCWCCAHWFAFAESQEKIERGFCEFYNKDCSAYKRVCKDFLLRNGLHTRKTIPEYCENYKENDK